MRGAPYHRPLGRQPWDDPKDPGHNPGWHTGKPCTVEGCNEPAGTVWFNHLCSRHSAEEMTRRTILVDDRHIRVQVLSDSVYDKRIAWKRSWRARVAKHEMEEATR